MDTLPPELLEHVFAFLSISDRLCFSRTSYYMYLNSWASLYSDVTFYADPYSANLTLGSASLLAQLYSQSDIRGKACNRMRLVRTLAVEPDRQPYFWATPNAYRTLNMVFLQLLKHKSIQCGLRTFRWSMGFSAGLERCHLPLPSHLTV